MYRLLGLLILILLIIGGLTGCTTTEFEVGPISVTPGEIVAGNTFTVEADISNIGENDGTFTVTLKLDERVFNKKKVMVAAGATETVRFDCVVETPGVHSLRLNDSTATFTALKPAVFTVTFLSIPAEANMREAIVIEANVTNIGEVEGIYNPRLMVNETETVGKDIMIAPGATETVSLPVTIEVPGTYTIGLDGATATLTIFLAFPDPNLKVAIREAINKPEGAIYLSDLKSLTNLVASQKGISDISGLEYCSNLQGLDLQDNNISDISLLADLKNLHALHLNGNNISDIMPLSGLTNLRGLWLTGNSIDDISPISGLTRLESLVVTDNNISDISALAGLTTLNWLDLTSNSISDISPLSGLINLEWLPLGGNNISDISPLVDNSGLSEGDFVHLGGNPLSDESMNVYIPQLLERGVDVQR